MFDTIIAQLLAWSLEIKNQTQKFGNTETLVGGLFEQIVSLIGRVADYIANIAFGIILKGEKANEAEIKAILNPTRGDTWKALDTGHYWIFDGTQWNDVGVIVPSNAATREELNNLDEATKAAQNISFFTNGKYLIGFTSLGERILGGWQKNGKFDAKAGLSDELGQKVYSQIIELTYKLNRKYIWAVFTPSGRIVLAIKKKDGRIVGKFEELEALVEDIAKIKNYVDYKDAKIIYLNGNSLMAGATSSTANKRMHVILQKLLGSDYEVRNFAVGGETSHTIAARQGGVPCWCIDEFTLPADTSQVAISTASNVRLQNKYGKPITPALQGSAPYINPCYVQNIACTLSYNSSDTTWYIQRNTASDSETLIIAKSLIFFNNAFNERNPHAVIFWAGANNPNYNSDENRQQLIQTYKDMVSFSVTENFLIIGDPMNDNATADDIEALKVTEQMLSDEFGLRFFNWRERAINYALSDLGITPTQSDIDNIAIGKIPTSLLNDSIHYKDLAQAYQAWLFYMTLIFLGIVKTDNVKSLQDAINFSNNS